MAESNPYEPPHLEDDDSADGESPPDATRIIRWIPTAILGSILLGYATAFGVARWLRPPPEARLLPLLFFAIPPLVVAAAMTFWAIMTYRRRQAWIREQREKLRRR